MSVDTKVEVRTYCGETHEVTTLTFDDGLPVKTCPQVPDGLPVYLP